MSIELVTANDPRFDQLCHGQNARFPETKAEEASVVALCETSEDVAEALQRFVHKGLRPTGAFRRALLRGLCGQ